MVRALAVLILLCPGTVFAQAFAEVGARALGLGGAFVAIANGPTTAYWNPAAMPLSAPQGSFVYGRTTTDPEGLAGRLDDLAATRALSLDITSRETDGLRALELLGAIGSEPNAITGTRPAGAFFAGGSYGFSAYRTTLATAEPRIDNTHVDISTDPSVGLPFNSSDLVLRSLQLDDYLFSIAGSLGDPRLLFGASVRYTRGKSSVSSQSLFQFDGFETSDVFDLAEKGNKESDNQWSFDTAALAIPHPKLRFGVVGKYLGEPAFQAADGQKLRLEPRWRTGVALLPHPQFTLSADLDLTTTSLTDTAPGDRNAAFGAQLTFADGRFALRGGLREPLEGAGGRLITGGVGFLAGGSLLIDAAIGHSPSVSSTIFAIEVGFVQKTARR